MGHIAAKKPYLDLQKRLDKMPIGAPSHKALFEILEQLFTSEECRIATAMPIRLTPADKIAKIAGMDESRVETLLSDMVEKGLAADFPRKDGRIFYYLNPTVIGFFEFTMMRVRNNVDQKKIASLMWEYLVEDPELSFMKMMSAGDTFIARPMVHEDTLKPEVYTEVLDYEKASETIRNAGSWAMGLCHCRHVKLHLDKPCDYPIDHCLSLGLGAEYLIRSNIAKRISREEALDVLDHAREHGLVQMADNVKEMQTFICNCCKCCCEIMEGFRTIPENTKVVSSNYIAKIDDLTCNGCGKCAKACPVNIIDMVKSTPTPAVPKRKKEAVVNSELCLGCGVCRRTCEFDALTIERIPVRVHTPDGLMEKLLRQAIERGKLQNILFDDVSKVTHRTLQSLFSVIVSLPPAKQILAREQVKSRFVDLVISGIRASGVKGTP